MSSPLSLDLAQKIIEVLLQRQHVLLSKGGKPALVRELADRMNETLATIIGRMPPPGIVDNEVTSTFGDESLDDAVEEMVEDVTASLMDSDQVEDVFSEDAVIRRDVFRIVKETLLSAERAEGDADEADVEVTLSTLGYVATKAAQGAIPQVVETALSRAAKASRAKLLKYDPSTLTAVFRAALSGPDARLELEEAVADELSNLVDEGLVELPMIERRIAIGRSVASDERHATRARIDVAATRTLLRSGCTATWEYVAEDTIKVSLVPMSEQDGRAVDAYVEAFAKEIQAVFSRPRPEPVAPGGGMDAWLRLARAASLPPTGKPAAKAETKSAAKAEAKSAAKAETKSAAKAETKSVAKPETKSAGKPSGKAATKPAEVAPPKSARPAERPARASDAPLPAKKAARPAEEKAPAKPAKPAKEPKAAKEPTAKELKAAKEPKTSSKKAASRRPADEEDDDSEPVAQPKAKLAKKRPAKPAEKVVRAAKKAVAKKAVAKKAVAKKAARKPAAKKAVAKKAIAKKAVRKPAAKKAVAKKPVRKPVTKKAVAKKAVRKPAAKRAIAKKAVRKPVIKKTVAKKAARKPAAKKAVRKPAAKRAVAKKAVRKPAAKKAVAKKAVRKHAAKRAVAKKAVRKAVAKKAVRKPAAKKAVRKPVAKKAVRKPAAKRAVAKKKALPRRSARK